jgi:hypothetical protein
VEAIMFSVVTVQLCARACGVCVFIYACVRMGSLSCCRKTVLSIFDGSQRAQRVRSVYGQCLVNMLSAYCQTPGDV